MITKELLIEELETINDAESLELVHQLIQQIKQQQKTKKPSLMSQLRSVKKINVSNQQVLNALNDSLTEFDDLYRELAK